MLCPKCSETFDPYIQEFFGSDKAYFRCPSPDCAIIMLSFEDHSDIERYLVPTIESKTVDAIVHLNEIDGPFLLAKLPKDWEIAWSVYVSRDGEVFRFKSLRKRWKKVRGAHDPSRDQRPTVNLARHRDRIARGRHRITYVYWIQYYAGWMPLDNDLPALIRHRDDNPKHMDASNLVGGTHRENAMDFATNRKKTARPRGKTIKIPIGASTLDRVSDRFQIKGRKLYAKIEEIVLASL